MEQLVWKIYLVFWLVVLGAALGSFSKCAAGRHAAGERGRALFGGRSRCDSCGHTLSPRDLVPVASWLLARGRCRYCGAKIPASCLWAELAGCAAFAALGWRFGFAPALGQWLVFGALLLAVSLIDGKERIIPDGLTLALALNRLAWVPLLGEPLLPAAKEALLSLLAGPVPLLLLVLGMERLLGREAMGGGDLKLLGSMALYLTWSQMLLTLLAAALLGLLAAALGKRESLPFAPFLSAGAVLAVTAGTPFLRWYLSFF